MAELDDLPGLAAFGERLTAVARVEEARPHRSWRRLRELLLAGALLLGVAVSAGAATAAVLRATVIAPPDARDVPSSQLAARGSSTVLSARAADPLGGAPWALRVGRSRTGSTCITVGQAGDRGFGITGTDGIFRRIPETLVDACGQRHGLLGTRIVADGDPSRVRTVVYGLTSARTVTLNDGRSARSIDVADGGFVAAVRGYPEDQPLRVKVDGRDVSLGAGPGLVLDPDIGPAWRAETLALGSRIACAHLRAVRSGLTTPTACLRVGSSQAVVAAQTFHPGDQGTPGFDRWNWGKTPARTVVWGVVAEDAGIRSLRLADGTALTLRRDGAFGIVLPATTDPASVAVTVTRADGSIQRLQPGASLVPDVVPSRRMR